MLKKKFCLENKVLSSLITQCWTIDFFFLHKFDRSYRPPYIGKDELLQNVTTELSKTGRTKLPISNGDDKASIPVLSGGKGRGKSRTLFEIACHFHTHKETYVIVVTYNSFAAQPFRDKREDETVAQFAREDLAARLAYCFYRQNLALSHPPMSFNEFVSTFENWNFKEVMDTISNFVKTKVLLLIDEILT